MIRQCLPLPEEEETSLEFDNFPKKDAHDAKLSCSAHTFAIGSSGSSNRCKLNTLLGATNMSYYQKSSTQAATTTVTMSAILLISLLTSWSGPCSAFHSSAGPVMSPFWSTGQLPETALFVVEPKERTVETLRQSRVITDIPIGVSTNGRNGLVDAVLINASDQEVTTCDDDGKADHSTDNNEAKHEEDNQDKRSERLANAAKAAALLSLRNGKTSGKVTTSTKTTSVGTRRIGSASQARTGARSMTRLTDAVKKVASANSVPKNQETPKTPFTGSTSRAATTVSVIQATVECMLQNSASMGLFGGVEYGPSATAEPFLQQDPAPGTVLIRSERSTKPWSPSDRILVRVASVHDDLEIANLRLSVFSAFSPDIRQAFCAKSCQVLSSRRHRGATCIVATVPRYGSIMSPRSDIILGTAECSFHEFEGTSLGRQRQAKSILYITEVAVSPSARQKGIGQKIMESIDELARIRGVETLFLHVDVNNHIALKLYARSGYRMVATSDQSYDEFTKSLNLHDGATKGRNHYLLHKNLLQPTWLSDQLVEELSQKATLGFEITS